MTDTLESPKDLGTDQTAVVTRWLKELALADKHERDWRERGEKVIKRFRDERDRAKDDSKRQFNILFANTEVLKGVMYAIAPRPDVRRRHKGDDPIGREAAQLLNDCLIYCIDAHDLDGVLAACTEDVLLPGRAVARVKYVPTFAKGADGSQQLVNEEAPVEYVEWDMFRYSPAKRWAKVRWVAFGELLTRDELKARFGDKGKTCTLDWMPSGMEDNAENQLFKRALVWAIWNKIDRKVYAICEGSKEAPLEVVDDPLKLQQFFPCPKPVYSVSTTNSLIPIPEFTLYQDQADELDKITQRIDVLTDALKRRGVYDASYPELEQLANAKDNEFIAISNFANFADKGGLDKALFEANIEVIAKVLVGLYNQRNEIKTTIYELTGISDIARGSTDPNETLGAQKLKSQYSNVRIGPRQKAIQQFARDLMRLTAEIISEHFSPETLGLMVGHPVDPPVAQVIKDDKLRGFIVDIETDSTIQPDADEEQKNRIELLTAITTFLQQAIPGVQMGAVPMDVAKELLMFGVRAFKTGPQLEQVLEQWTQKAPTGADPAAQQQQQAQMQQQEEAMQAQQQAMAKQGQDLMTKEQALKDQGTASDVERMKLDYDKKLFAMEQQVQKFMAAQAEQMKASQEQQKVEVEESAQAKVDEKEAILAQLVQSQQVVVEMLGKLLESQDLVLQGQAQIAEIASSDRESELIRGPNGKPQKAISRLMRKETLQ